MRPRFVTAIQTADALISIGRFTTDGFLQLGANPTKIHAIPNGVDPAAFSKQVDRPAELHPSVQPGKYFLAMGRLSRRKGFDVLVRALAAVQPGNSTDLVIAGSGTDGPEREIASLDLSDRVRMVGRVSGNLKTYLLQNALAVVVPSRGWEAFPLVVLEAYAAGQPVIGSRIPGLEDVVEVEETGLLFDSESEQDLARVLRRVREDSQWVQRAGANARLRAAAFGWDRIAGQHLDLYRQVRS